MTMPVTNIHNLIKGDDPLPSQYQNIVKRNDTHISRLGLLPDIYYIKRNITKGFSR